MNKSPRTSNLQLPNADELLDMVFNKESSRKAIDKQATDRAITNSFSGFRSLQERAGVYDITLFNRQIDSEKEFKTSIQSLSESVEETKKSILTSKPDTRLLESVFEGLSQQDTPTESDAIFVFGARSDIRITKALELFSQGLAPKLVVSGSAPNWQDNESISEAERMANIAMKNGVKEADIIVEDKGISIPDNVKRSLDLFEEEGFKPSRICIVVSEFALLRSTIDWNKFAPDIEVIRVAPKVQNEHLSKTGWWKESAGVNVVVNEYAKIILESMIDYLVVTER